MPGAVEQPSPGSVTPFYGAAMGAVTDQTITSGTGSHEADPNLDETDRAFVRSTGTGVLVGMIGMFAFVAGFTRLVAPDAGPAYWFGLAAFSALITGGFFGGVVFASKFLIEQEKREAAARAAAGDAGEYVRAA